MEANQTTVKSRIGHTPPASTLPSTYPTPWAYSVYLLVIILLGIPPVFASAAPSTPSASNVPTNPLSGLPSPTRGNAGPFSGGDLLPPDEAFPPPHLAIENARTLVVRWQISKGYYLYRDRFRFEIREGRGVELGPAEIPPGVFKEEEELGRVEVFHDEVGITLPIVYHGQSFPPQKGTAPLPARKSTGSPEDAITKKRSLRILVGYQGCAEAGLCYPPATKTLGVDLPIADPSPSDLLTPDNHRETVPDNLASANAAGTATHKTMPAESDRLAHTILGGSLWVVLPIFFGFGLLLGFTPCVFPMIPILAGIIVGQGEGITTRKALALSAVYVLAMALTYTAAGVIAGLFGHNLQAAFQNPWIIGLFSAVFVLLALSMFGLFEIRMPTAWQTGLATRGNLQKGGTFLGVGIMGLLSALIVGPCVAPPLAGALIAIGATGDPSRGGLALFSLSLGMGAPLIAIGTSAGRWLPKTGPWMAVINKFFGMLLLAVALYLLERILPGRIGMFPWALFLIMIGVYLGPWRQSGGGNSGWQILRKGAGIIAMAYGILVLVSAGMGGKDVFRPLEGFSFTATDHAPIFERVETHEELQSRLTTIRVENSARDGTPGRLTMLDYYADWCIECKRMETRTFSDPDVRQALANMVLLQADVTDNDDQDRALLAAFGLYGPPAILFFGPDGKEYADYRVQGFMDAGKFREHVRRLRETVAGTSGGTDP
uniref:Thiol:disulfide interchange protein DsbD n=1 Tax=Candidatus Kentrum sp. FW TaxID=2126338 RepID=A0A450U0A8_9GAMM|nr:MAG: thiol:disulfide interchange protein DsbD [Candidatus Kentron sp. FW]